MEGPALIIAKCCDHQSRTVSHEVRQEPKSQLTMVVQPQRKKCRCLWKIQIRGDKHNEELDSSAKVQMVNRMDDYTVMFECKLRKCALLLLFVKLFRRHTKDIPNKYMRIDFGTATTSGLRKGQRHKLERCRGRHP